MKILPRFFSRGSLYKSRRPGGLNRDAGRFILVLGLFAFCFAAVGIRLAGLGLGDAPAAGRSAAHAAPVDTARPIITDRHGEILATNVKTAILYADARNILGIPETIAGLTSVLPGLDAGRLHTRLDSNKAFIRLARNLTPAQQYQVHNLGLPGIGFREELRRVYPNGDLVSHLLGYVDIDNTGIAGFEQFMDSETYTATTARGTARLALDIRIQHILRQQLQTALAEYQARAGGGIVLDVNTGEIIAMVSLPDFDPNSPADYSPSAQFSQMTKGTYEMGSIFKLFTFAMAFESGTITLASGYDATEPLRIGKYSINDYHPESRYLSVPEIFLYSSNIGAAKMALDVGVTGHKAFLSRLGLLSRPELEMPELGRPQVPDNWQPVRSATIAFGHGLAVTPLQIAVAAAALVNGGWLIKPTLLKRSPGKLNYYKTRVVSEKTSGLMRQLLALNVVDPRGSGKQAAVPGYQIGGKTGTAEKPGAGGYQKDKLLTSFLAVFPIDEPQYIVFVFLDEPKATEKTRNYATAGWNAAPTVGKIITAAAPLLGVLPALPETDAMQTIALNKVY